jgi:hypothetical protein
MKPLALGLSVGFFGIVAARTIGALVKRHVNTVRGRPCPLRAHCNALALASARQHAGATDALSQLETVGSDSLKVQ